MFHHIEESDSRGGVQVRRGLIRENERRFGNHRASNGDPLLLTAGQLRWATIFKTSESDF